MASDNDVSCCESDPNFAVICAFIEKFGVTCGLSNIDFVELQEMLENTREVPPLLIDLHVKLMRKARKSVTSDKWEKIVVKICQSLCTQDAWEVERFGYKNAKLSSKIRILKELLEMQFDYFTRFKTDVNKMPATELRTQPLGRDKMGNIYWFLSDESYQIKVYKEDPENENFELVAKDKDSLFALILDLNDEETKPFTRKLENNDYEASNDSSIDKPLMDTGQSEFAPNAKIDAYENSTPITEKCTAERRTTQNISQQSTISLNLPKQTVEKKLTSEEPKLSLKLRPLADLQKTSTTDSDSSVNSEEHPCKKLKIEKIRIRNISSGNAEIGEIIEDPPIIITGEGSGYENEEGNSVYSTSVCQAAEENIVCMTGNDFVHNGNPIVGEEIVESTFYVYGYGHGMENTTGNDSKTEDNDLKSDRDSSVLSDNRTLKTSGNSVSHHNITEGEVIDGTPLQQDVPTSPAKNAYKLGTILDTKTDRCFSPKCPIKKSRWDVENSEHETAELDAPLGSELAELKEDITPGKVKDLVEKFEELSDTESSKRETQTKDSSVGNSTFFFGPCSSPFKYGSSVKDSKENLPEQENNQDANVISGDKTSTEEIDESVPEVESSTNGLITDTTDNVDTGDMKVFSNCDTVENDNEETEKQIEQTSEVSSVDDGLLSDDVSKTTEVETPEDTNNDQEDINLKDGNLSTSLGDLVSETSKEYETSTNAHDVEVSSTSDQGAETSATLDTNLVVPECSTENVSDTNLMVPECSTETTSDTNLMVQECSTENVSKSSVDEPIESMEVDAVGATEHTDILVDSSQLKEQDPSCDKDEETEPNDTDQLLESDVADAVVDSTLHTEAASVLPESQITSTNFDTVSSDSKIVETVDSTGTNGECNAPDSELASTTESENISSTNMEQHELPILPPSDDAVDDIYSTVDSVCPDNILSDINSGQVSDDALGENLSSDVNIGTGDEPSNIIDFDLPDDVPVSIPIDESVTNDDSESSITDAKDVCIEDTNRVSDTSDNIDDMLQDESPSESTLKEDSALQENKVEDVSLDTMLSGDITKEVSLLESSPVNEVAAAGQMIQGASHLDQLADDVDTNLVTTKLLENEASVDVPDLETPMNKEAVLSDDATCNTNTPDETSLEESAPKLLSDDNIDSLNEENNVTPSVDEAAPKTLSDDNVDSLDEENNTEMSAEESVPNNVSHDNIDSLDEGNDVLAENSSLAVTDEVVDNQPDVHIPTDDVSTETRPAPDTFANNITTGLFTDVVSENKDAENMICDNEMKDENVVSPGASVHIASESPAAEAASADKNSASPIAETETDVEISTCAPTDKHSVEAEVEVDTLDEKSVSSGTVSASIDSSGQDKTEHMDTAVCSDSHDEGALENVSDFKDGEDGHKKGHTVEEKTDDDDQNTNEKVPSDDEQHTEGKEQTEDTESINMECIEDKESQSDETNDKTGNDYESEKVSDSGVEMNVDNKSDTPEKKESPIETNDKVLTDEILTEPSSDPKSLICVSESEKAEEFVEEQSESNTVEATAKNLNTTQTHMTDDIIAEDKNINQGYSPEDIVEDSENIANADSLLDSCQNDELTREKQTVTDTITESNDVSYTNKPTETNSLVNEEGEVKSPNNLNVGDDDGIKSQLDESKEAEIMKNDDADDFNSELGNDEIKNKIDDANDGNIECSSPNDGNVQKDSIADKVEDNNVPEHQKEGNEASEGKLNKEDSEEVKEGKVEEPTTISESAGVKETAVEKTDDTSEQGTIDQTKIPDSSTSTETISETKDISINEDNIPQDSTDVSDKSTKHNTEQESKRRSTRCSGKDFTQVVKERSKKTPKSKRGRTDQCTHEANMSGEEAEVVDNADLKTSVSENQQEDIPTEEFQPVVVVERTEMGSKDEETVQPEAKTSKRRSGRFSREIKETDVKIKTGKREAIKEDVPVRSRRARGVPSKDENNEISTDSDSGRRKSDLRKKRGRPKETADITEDKVEHSTDEGSDRPLRGRRSGNIIAVKQKGEQKNEQPTSSKKVKLTEEVKLAEVKISRRGRPRNSSPQESAVKQKLTPSGRKPKSTVASTTPTQKHTPRGTKGLRSSSSGSTPVASPHVVSVECDAIIDSCSDLVDFQERDPLAVTESDPESSKASFSTPYTDSTNLRTRRSLRKRGLDSPENIPDPDEAIGKKPKLKGKRSSDLQLRRSIEEKKRAQVVSSSEEDVSVLTDSNSTQENKIKSPAKRGRKSKTPQKKTAHTDSPNSEIPQPSKKKKIIETRNSKSKKR